MTQAAAGDIPADIEKPTASVETKLARILLRHLRFLCDICEDESDLCRDEYGPGLVNANAVAVFSSVLGHSFPESNQIDRSRIERLRNDAYRRIAAYEPSSVAPQVWGYVAYSLVVYSSRVSSGSPPSIAGTDPDAVSRLVEGIVSCANRLLEYVFPSGLYRDTKAEETCWTASPLVGAMVTSPDHPHYGAWEEAAHRFYLNAYNREADFESGTVVEGKRLSDRVVTANLFEDYTCENHGAFHPVYQMCINNYAIPYLLYRDRLGRVPESLTWNWEGIHDVARRIIRANGRIASPGGTDYFAYSHAEQVHYLALIADALDDELAYYALDRGADRLLAFQDLHADRLVGEYLGDPKHLMWEFHFASFVAFAHALIGNRVHEPIDPDAAASIGSGPWSSSYTRFTVHKSLAFHSGYALKTILNRRPGSGFFVPSDEYLWTDHFCTMPSLSPVVYNHAGDEVGMGLVDHRIGHDAFGTWALGMFADEREYLRRCAAFVTGPGGAVHIERIFRYGEQVPIFGSDGDLSHSRAIGDEFGAWRVDTLNYRVVNDELERRVIRIETESDDRRVSDTEEAWTSVSPWVLIDRRIGIVQLGEPQRFGFTYRYETEGLSPNHYWKHRTWALNTAIRGREPAPRGYGLMGAHVVLIVPASDPGELARLREEVMVREMTSGGDVIYRIEIPALGPKRRVVLGHHLGIDTDY